MFELEQEITRWRERLSYSESLTPDHIAEMESHLRDSVEALQSRELTADEAFLIATRRLGTAEELKREFNKENLATLWAGRVMWILVGAFFLRIVLKLCVFLGDGIGATVMQLFNDHRLAGASNQGTKAFLAAVILYELYYILSAKGRPRLEAMDRAFRWAFQNPLKSLAGLLTCWLIVVAVAFLPVLSIHELREYLMAGKYQLVSVPLRLVVIPMAKVSMLLLLAYWIHRRLSTQIETA